MSEGQPLGNPRTRSESKCSKCEDVMKQLKIAIRIHDNNFYIVSYDHFSFKNLQIHTMKREKA